jgi:hypothetical protein
MTSNEIERRGRPWFGLASVIAPSIDGLFLLVREQIGNRVQMTLWDVVLIALFILCALGVTFAVVSLCRQESWRWLAILGLVVNGIVLAVLLVCGGILLLLGDRRVV